MGHNGPMGFIDRLLGRDEPRRARDDTPRAAEPDELSDEQALERYRYLVRTAPPDRIEEAHQEAFAKLTPEQRQTALRELNGSVPEGERSDRDDPRSLARVATRADMRRPGTVERAFGGAGGGMLGGTLLGSFAAAFAGSLVAQSLFAELGGDEPSGEGEGAGAEGEPADAGAEGGGLGDFGGGDFGGGDIGI
jgi:hypothetical protein